MNGAYAHYPLRGALSASGFGLRVFTPACLCLLRRPRRDSHFCAIMAIQLQLSPPLRSGKLWIMVGSPPQPVNWWLPPYITSSPLNIGWCIHAVELSGDPSTLGITWTFTRNLHGGDFSISPPNFMVRLTPPGFLWHVHNLSAQSIPPLGGIPSSKSLGLAI